MDGPSGLPQLAGRFKSPRRPSLNGKQKGRLIALGVGAFAVWRLSVDPATGAVESMYAVLFGVLAAALWFFGKRRGKYSTLFPVLVGLFAFLAAGRPTSGGSSNGEQTGAALATILDGPVGDTVRALWTPTQVWLRSKGVPV